VDVAALEATTDVDHLPLENVSLEIYQ